MVTVNLKHRLNRFSVVSGALVTCLGLNFISCSYIKNNPAKILDQSSSSHNISGKVINVTVNNLDKSFNYKLAENTAVFTYRLIPILSVFSVIYLLALSEKTPSKKS